MTYIPRHERTTMAGRPHSAANMLACGLGMLSIGFGLAQLLSPRARGHGPEAGRNSSGLLQLDGLVEAAIGVGLLAGRSRRNWMWGRTLNHAFQAGLLLPRLRSGNPHRTAAGAAVGGLAASLAVDMLCARQLSHEEQPVVPGSFRDYSDRSGFPEPPDKMRGAARR